MPIHEKIIEFIKRNQIKKLNLLGQTINNDDIKSLALLLENNTSIRCLELPCKELTEEAYVSFFQWIQYNTRLEVLRFHEMPRYFFKLLLEILPLNKTLIDIQEVIYDYGRRSFVRESLKNEAIVAFLARNKTLKISGSNLSIEEENLSLFDQVATLILKQMQLTAKTRELQRQLIQIQRQRPPYYDGISIVTFYLTAYYSYNQSMDVHANNLINLNREVLTLIESNKQQGLIHFLSACQIDHELLAQLVPRKSQIFTAFQTEVECCISKEEKLVWVNIALNKTSGLYQVFSYQQSYFGYYIGSIFKKTNTIWELQKLKAKLEKVNDPHVSYGSTL